MSISLQACRTENDYFRVRNFLRQVFLLNDRLEHSWHVARLDYWRWHFIENCHLTPPFEQVIAAWETEHGELAAEHWWRGLGKAILFEGMRRLKQLGCTRVFATANEEPADALYRSVMTGMKVTDTWIKRTGG